MRSWHAIMVLAGALLIPFNSAKASCTCDWICIQPTESSGGAGLVARNRSQVPLTFSVQFNTGKYIVNGPTKLTRTLAAGDSMLLPVVSRDGDTGGNRRAFRCQWTIGNMDAAHDERLIYRLPYASGRSYRVLQGFGSRFSHTGTEQFAVDFKMEEGTPVHAARGGVVARTEASNSIGCWKDECAGRANYIVILHDDETTGEYYHLLQDGVLVEVGERVVTGQKIGLSGNTGHSALPHLHFGIYRAIENGKEQSIPFRFLSADGIVDGPRRGGMYVAVDPQDADPLYHDQQAGADSHSTVSY